MKTTLMMCCAATLAATCVCPLPAFAAKAAAAKDAAAEAPAKPKKKMAKKPNYTKFKEAFTVAEANDEPVLVLLKRDKNEQSTMLEKELFKKKQFIADYAKENLVLLVLKLKLNKDGTKIDQKSLKPEEVRFLENFGVDEKAAAQAKQKGDTISPMDIKNYPAIICVKGSVENQEQLFRMDAYDKDGGFGVWLTSLDALLRTKEIEPKVSPAIQKILDDPTAFAGGGKKKGK